MVSTILKVNNIEGPCPSLGVEVSHGKVGNHWHLIPIYGQHAVIGHKTRNLHVVGSNGHHILRKALQLDWGGGCSQFHKHHLKHPLVLCQWTGLPPNHNSLCTIGHIAFCSLISLDHHWEANAQGELSWVVVGILVWQCPQLILEMRVNLVHLALDLCILSCF